MRILVALLLCGMIMIPTVSAYGDLKAEVWSSATGSTPSSATRSSCPCLPHPLVLEAQNIFSRMTYTAYQRTPDMNDTTGVYLCDCSDYINTLLKRSSPAAYGQIPNYQRSPTTKDYHTFFTLLKTSPSAGSLWYRIRDARKLCPGDVIVWRNETAGTGHIGLIMTPASINPSRPDEVLVRIADSTTSLHADDTRAAGTTGIGSGLIGIKIDSSGSAVGIYWKGGISRTAQLVNVKVGRLMVSEY